MFPHFIAPVTTTGSAQSEMSLMLCLSLLKCLATGKEKSDGKKLLHKTIGQSALGFSSLQLIAFLTGVMGNKYDPLILVVVCMWNN